MEFEFDDTEIVWGDVIIFDELIERTEEMRFFTLDEQLTDYTNKRLPENHVTRHIMNEIHNDAERIKQAYLKYVELREDGYRDREFEWNPKPSWIHPLIEDYTYYTYNYDTKWSPLFESRASDQNFYSRMVDALPRPYITEGSNILNKKLIGYSKSNNELQVRGLPNYQKTKTIYHDDGTLDIYNVDITNTNDNIKQIGYIYDKRDLELPIPHRGVRFLEDTNAGTFETTEPLNDIYPALGDIMRYAIPRTQDPYTEAYPFLKLWDLKLSEIPWKLWKNQFPPVESPDATPEILSVNFGTNQPPTGIKNDVLTLLKRVIDAGSLGVVPIEHRLDTQVATSTPEECLKYDTFQDFLNSGVYRNKVCYPVDFILNQRASLISEGRKPFTENTLAEIDARIDEIRRDFQPIGGPQPKIEYKSVTSKEKSELRQTIELVLRDPMRTDEDKVIAITVLLQNNTMTKNVYYDLEHEFIICNHTLSILRGELEHDMNNFYRKWSAVDDGKRVCIHCGEKVGDVFAAVTEYDEDGRVMNTHSPMKKATYHGKSKEREKQNLSELMELTPKEIKGSFTVKLFFHILKVTGILPTESQLKPIIKVMTRQLNSLTKKQITLQKEAYASIAITYLILLIQLNFLLPKRRFGKKSLSFTGFPRDGSKEEAKESNVIDSMLYIVSYNDVFNNTTGPLAWFAKYIKTNKSEFKKSVIDMIFSISGLNDIKNGILNAQHELLSSKKDLESITVESAEFALPNILITQTEFTPLNIIEVEQTKSLICKAIHPYDVLLGEDTVEFRAAPIELNEIDMHEHSIEMEKIPPSIEARWVITQEDIVRYYKLGIHPKFNKIPKLVKLLEGTDPDIIMTVLLRLSAVIHIPNDEVASEEKISITAELYDVDLVAADRSSLRDLVKGYFYRFLKLLGDHPNSASFVEEVKMFVAKDAGFKLATFNYDDAIKTEQEAAARERYTLVDALNKIKDDEYREIARRLMQNGLIPHLVSNTDRKEIARALELSRYDNIEEMFGGNVAGDGEMRTDAEGNELTAESGEYGTVYEEQYDDSSAAAMGVSYE